MRLETAVLELTSAELKVYIFHKLGYAVGTQQNICKKLKMDTRTYKLALANLTEKGYNF